MTVTSQCPHFHVLPSTLSPPTVARGRDPLARASESLLAPSSPHCPTFNTHKPLYSPEVQHLQGGEAREAAGQRLGPVVADLVVAADSAEQSGSECDSVLACVIVFAFVWCAVCYVLALMDTLN